MVIPNFFCKDWKNLRNVLVIRNLHVLKLRLCVHRRHQFPGARRVRRFNPVFQFPGVRISSIFLSPHLRILDRILAWIGPHLFPGGGNDRLVLHRLDLPDLAEDSSSHSTGCATPDSRGSTSPSPDSLALVLPSVNLHWKSFLAFLFDMALCFLIGSRRKLLKWQQENEKTMMLNTRRR